MGLLSWIRGALAPSRPKLTGGAPITGEKPLHQQYQRIGGGLTPADVTLILQGADSGQPARFVDLANESRQKDGHLQSAMFTRESAPALVDLEFITPEDATSEEREAADMCRQLRDDFRDWSTMIQHLNGAYFGHASVELKPWQQARNGYLLPNECKTLHARDFIFSQNSGKLAYARTQGDLVGVDLLAEFPGRIVQVQRRIVGDVQAREGLARILVWGALLRNWTLREWLALGETGWKPRMWALFPEGMHDDEQIKLLRKLELMIERGVAAFPENIDLKLEWPKGAGSGSGAGVHREFFDALGREMSKAIVGQTTSIEVGPNGSRADTKARDELRTDIRECDCRAIAAALRYHMFAPAVAINIGTNLRMPVPWFSTDDATDQLSFAKAVGELKKAGLRIGAKWVRDEFGMPEPEEGDELLEVEVVDAEEEDEGSGGDEEELEEAA